MATESLKVTPISLDTNLSSYDSINSVYPLRNILGKDETNSTFTRFNMNTGVLAYTYVFLVFDFSAIPENATINRVSCSCKCKCSNSSAVVAGNNDIALCENSNVIVRSSSTQTFYTSASTETISSVEITRAQLNNLRFRLLGVRGSIGVNKTYYLDLYGVSITVEYTTQDQVEMQFSVNGTWLNVTEAYVKSDDGIWMKQEDFTKVFDESKTYVAD